MRRCFAIGLLVVLCAGPVRTVAAAGREFRVRFLREVHSQPYSGRVYLFFSKQANGEPRFGPDWFQPEPFAAADVENWQPGAWLSFGGPDSPALLSFPKPFDELELAEHKVQAVARFNPQDRRVGRGAGNGFSKPVPIAPDDTETKVPELTIDTLATEPEFVETPRKKLLAAPSRLLSKFYGRDTSLHAIVTLPASYADSPGRHYPVVFEIPGFGGTHLYAVDRPPFSDGLPGGIEFLHVMLDPSCPLGHHAFADSDNNGPVGQALVTEFIPEFERRFRAVRDAWARFLTGHSSGGWSSLWLLITYPDDFAGTWSTAPDPVDFRDFQQINLYRPGENMYRNERGERRPIARMNGKPVLWYDRFDAMETVLGPGGQLHSFEAVFSPRGSDGRPVPVWNRSTGVVDEQAARHWEKYDIRLILERNWKDLGPKIDGKLHVIMGDADTFYLEGAVRLLQNSLAKFGARTNIEIVPGKDHFNLRTQDLVQKIRREMAQAFLVRYPEQKREPATSTPPAQ